MSSGQQYLRKATLVVVNEENSFSSEKPGLDLSNLRFTFNVQQADVQSPNNAAIRVYNLNPATEKQIKGEFSSVMIQAGYESGYGTIFQGSIKQFRSGRESATETFLDILASDTDIEYNFSVISKTLAEGSTSQEHFKEVASAMDVDISNFPDLTGTNVQALARGKVLFGMARSFARDAAATLGATWSIQNGQMQILKYNEYLPGEAVVINSATGMIGIPEQTDAGIKVRCLLNPNLRVGGLIKLNNADITQLILQNPSALSPFNQWKGVQFASKLAEGADGDYRVYVVEHTGDTRGQEWYSDLVCLKVDSSTQKVVQAAAQCQ